jgi:hypothetical protein
VPMFVYKNDYSYGSYYQLVTPTREAIWNMIRKRAQTTKMQRASFKQILPHSMSMAINGAYVWSAIVGRMKTMGLRLLWRSHLVQNVNKCAIWKNYLTLQATFVINKSDVHICLDFKMYDT